VNLDEVVKATLDRSPDVLVAREDIAGRTGRLRETKGAFDSTLHLGATYQHTDTYISGTWWNEEYKRRTQFEQAHAALTLIRQQLADAIARGSAVKPVCPPGSTFVPLDATVPGQLPRPVCTPVTSDPFAADLSTLDPANFDITRFYMPASPTRDPMSALEFTRKYAQINGLPINTFVEDSKQRGYDELLKSYSLVSEYELRTQMGLDRLGPFPSFEVRNTVRLNGDFTKPLRSGGYVQVSAYVDGVENSFRGKPLDPKFGGKELQNRFRGHVEGVWSQPLLRGRGATSVIAPERSAAANLQAGRFSYLHTVSKSVLDSTIAYLDLLAAEQSLALLQDSLTAQRRMLDANTRLAAAGEVARSDVNRMQARVADVEVSVAQARQDLISKQTAVAVKAGMRAEDIAAQIKAGEKYPDEPLPVDVDAVVRAGIVSRNDIRAADASRRSARVLLDAAVFDAKPRLDMQVRAGITNVYYSPYFRVLIDEFNRCTSDWSVTRGVSCYEPRDTPVNYFNVVGVGRAYGTHWSPTAAIQFKFELPFGNNTLMGRVEKSRAAVHRADIQVMDLGRVATENIAQNAASLQKARDEWVRRREAVERYTTSWTDTDKRRAAGDMTLIDTLLTEQDLTNARLSLVQAQHDYAAALARLRYETGTLVVVRNDRPEPDLSGLVIK
jgi:outer membrane protein TolC